MSEPGGRGSDPRGSPAGAAEPSPPARPPRLDPLAVRRELREAGLRPRHALSQNFLADPDVLQAILDVAAPASGRRIVEVGPGLGILTGGLLAAGAAVTAVELDSRLAARLRDRFAGAIARAEEDPGAPGALRVVEADVLDVPPAELAVPPYEVVANVPYHISSPLLHEFLGAPPRPVRLVLMLQREVAERIAARPGGMSYLSVFVQYHASVHVAFGVPREAFEPPPEVASAVVVLEPFDPSGSRPRLRESEEEDLWRLVQAGFRERRKMLRNVLARQLPVSGAELDAALGKAHLAGDRRPQTLAVDDWLALREAFGRIERPPEARGGRTRRSEAGR